MSYDDLNSGWNIRIIKKKSKQAVSYLEKLGIKADVFLSRHDENYHGFRVRCQHKVKGKRRGYCHICTCVLPGTPMTGEVSGYYEPEWDERPIIDTLMEFVRWNDKPENVSDKDWIRILKIANVNQLSEADIMGMWGQS